MLTNEQIQANKIKYLELLSKLHFDMTQFSVYLDAVGYFTAPNTTQYHRAYEGGLCQTALDTYDILLSQANHYFPGMYTEEYIIAVALFRNIYRAEMYEYVPSRGVYQTRKERPTYGNLGLSSLMTVEHFYKDLTDEQKICIMHGSSSCNEPDLYDMRRSYKLLPLVTITDIIVSSYFN